jgi:fructan beta-fructosidase
MTKINCLLLGSLTLICACVSPKTEPKKQRNAEQHRPKYHFTPQKGWMNDPNGMVYYKGEYHLFYQYYPDSTVWGPMHWAHSVSKDLMNWESLPIALAPDEKGYIFSGSAVVDENNTSGFQTGEEKALVAIFTYHDMAAEKAGRLLEVESQGIAYSLDKGRTWTKYAQNPVIKNPKTKDFRDPNVKWHEPSKQWMMTLAVGDHVEFYASKNLKEWVKTGEFGKTEGGHGGVWECPDLFPLKVEGSNTEKWVLIQNIGRGAIAGGSGTQYFIGNYDGKVFKNDNKPTDILWLDYGADNYAGVTWNNAPDNRRLFLGWMSNWLYATKVPTGAPAGVWRSAMTLPRELSLKNTAQGIRLFQKPVKEQNLLRTGAKQDIATQTISTNYDLKPKSICNELSLSFDLTKTTAQDFGVILSNSKGEKVLVGYEKSSNRFYIDRNESGKKDFEKIFATRHYAPRTASNSLLTMKLHIDVASVELFADGGELAMTDIFFPNEDFNKMEIFSKNGVAALTQGEMWQLK